MKTILAPIDFSGVSESVVREAAALARTFDGRVVLMAVVQPPVIVTEYATMVDMSELTAAGEKNADRQLETLKEKLESQFVKTETVRVTGVPVVRIIEQAEKHEADYIVMGSHGHTAFYELIVGSTTQGVLKRASCPVMIVPAAKDTPKPSREKRRATVL